MLEKILKIISTIESCKRISQLEQCMFMIETFERDEKPKDERIIEGILKCYRIKKNKILKNDNQKAKILINVYKINK